MSDDSGKKEILNLGSDDNPLGSVAESDKKGLWSMSVVLLGFTFFTSTMYAGGNIGPYRQFIPDMLSGIFIGSVLLGVYAAILAIIAAETGYHSSVLMRYSLGEKGSKLADVLFALTELGWYAWGVATIAIVLVNFLGLSSAWLIPFMIIFGFGFSMTSYIGYKGIEILSKVSVPLMFIIMAISFVVGYKDVGGLPGLMVKPETEITMLEVVTVVFGTFVAGATQSTNWTRFSKTKKIAFWSTVIAFTIGNGLMIFFGAFGANIYKDPDIVTVLAMQGMRISAIVMLFLNMWTTQDNTIYCTTTALCNFFRTDRRRLINFISVVVAIILAIAGMYNWLMPYIKFMNIVIPPLGGIMLADYFVVKKSNYESVETVKLKDFHSIGLISYVMGALISIKSPGITPINGIIISFLVYIILSKITKKTCTL